jgi:hypothetical protein
MLFDVITALILFQCISVLSRSIERRRGDMLCYVSKSDTRWRR